MDVVSLPLEAAASLGAVSDTILGLRRGAATAQKMIDDGVHTAPDWFAGLSANLRVLETQIAAVRGVQPDHDALMDWQNPPPPSAHFIVDERGQPYGLASLETGLLASLLAARVFSAAMIAREIDPYGRAEVSARALVQPLSFFPVMDEQRAREVVLIERLQNGDDPAQIVREMSADWLAILGDLIDLIVPER